ncbi:MAG: hypothetical protein AB1611_07925 [bacterium]
MKKKTQRRLTLSLASILIGSLIFAGSALAEPPTPLPTGPFIGPVREKLIAFISNFNPDIAEEMTTRIEERQEKIKDFIKKIWSSSNDSLDDTASSKK